ncbi:NUDIX hydrolase [Pontibacillus halophilus JSM 076056 = DSM 19796]|uniref:NUDIX hydrolase n=1 Tax=Pontibacillus halophilus JSM 076056 = DSM 19796 TaxID=1385510 RepID=A0A0A5GI37_9BACI|nr:8-oxo-dGTP diphosphatase [Pontibacillus halophilus]KGX92906.1 NUDIX hydrolase [Pontibacillus halophilus JSM 076056 = DSM 19796]
MQRVANCILKSEDEVLLLKKPRRGWYVAPGGKMEPGEHVMETAQREFFEETGLQVADPELRGVFTFVMKEGDEVVREWMMFTFYSESYAGTLKSVSEEGELEWTKLSDVLSKPMAGGDRYYLKHILNHTGILYATFTYTQDFELLHVRLDANADS